MKLSNINAKGSENLRKKAFSVAKQQEIKRKEMEQKNLLKAIASERAYSKMMQTNEETKHKILTKIDEKKKKFEQRLVDLKHNSHRQSNPELQGKT